MLGPGTESTEHSLLSWTFSSGLSVRERGADILRGVGTQVCDALTHAVQPLCESCHRKPQLAAAVLTARSGRLDHHNTTLVRICLHCGGGGGRPQAPPSGSIACDSLDCAVFFERRKNAHELAAAQALELAGLQLLDGS